MVNAKQVVFVGGAQRSGTNMLMDVLERSFETDVYHETDPRAFDEYLMLPRPIIHRLVEGSPASRVVVKALCESQDIPELLDEFQPARGIWVVRHFDDVANSMNVSFPHHKKLMLKVAAEPTAGAWRTQKMSDETYAQIRPLIDEAMTDATAAALQWYLRNRLFFELEMHRHPQVLLVFYEDLVSDPETAFRRISAFMGIETTPFMIRHVHARSIRKRPSPALSAAAKELCKELWQQFEAER
jgi:hypothetical protein